MTDAEPRPDQLPPTRETNTLAIASVFVSVAGVLCFLGGLVGIVLGFLALRQIAERGEQGRRLAIGGIVVGVATIIFSIAAARLVESK